MERPEPRIEQSFPKMSQQPVALELAWGGKELLQQATGHQGFGLYQIGDGMASGRSQYSCLRRRIRASARPRAPRAKKRGFLPGAPPPAAAEPIPCAYGASSA